MDGIRDAAPRENVHDLAHAEDRFARGDEEVEPGLPRRFDREVATVRGPCERAGPSDERPRDDAADQVLALQDPPREAAQFPELLRRPDFLVGGHLEDRVPRGIEDRPAGRHVLLPQLSDDLCARCRPVAENLLSGALLERRDDFRRKAIGIERERAFRDEPHHLPVTRRGVLTRRQLEGLAPRALRRPATGQREHPQPLQVGKRRRMPIEDVSQSMAPGIAIGLGVRGRSYSQAVADYDDDASGHGRRGKRDHVILRPEGPKNLPSSVLEQVFVRSEPALSWELWLERMRADPSLRSG